MDSRQTVKIGWALGWYRALYLFIGEVARSGPHSNADHMARLGHSQISLTMNTYSHVLHEMTRAAIGVMDSVLGGK